MNIEIKNYPEVTLLDDLNYGDTFICPTENFALDEILMRVRNNFGPCNGGDAYAVNLLTGEIVMLSEDVVVTKLPTKLVNDDKEI